MNKVYESLIFFNKTEILKTWSAYPPLEGAGGGFGWK